MAQIASRHFESAAVSTTPSARTRLVIENLDSPGDRGVPATLCVCIAGHQADSGSVRHTGQLAA